MADSVSVKGTATVDFNSDASNFVSGIQKAIDAVNDFTTKLKSEGSEGLTVLQNLATIANGELTNAINKAAATVEKLNTELRQSAKEGENAGKQTTDGMKESEEAAKRYLDKLKSLNSKLNEISGMATMAAMQFGIGGGIITAALGESVKKAMDFEQAFVGVRKTVDATEQEYAELANGLRKMSTETSLAATELSGIAEMAGQMGVEKKSILGFTQTIADLSVATTLTGEEAASMMAQFANVTQMDQSKFANLGAAINALGNAGSSTEKDILSMAQRLAAAGTLAGMTQGDILGIATALSDMGIEAEAGGAAFSKLISDMSRSVASGGERLEQFAKVAQMSGKEFAKIWEESPSAAVTKFLEGLAKIREEGGNVSQTLIDLGIEEIRMTNAVSSATLAVDKFATHVKTGNDEFERGLSLKKESKKFYATATNQLTMLGNAFGNLRERIGIALTGGMGHLAGFFSFVKTGMVAITEWMEKHPIISSVTVTAVAAFGLALLTLGGLLTGVAIVSSLAGFAIQGYTLVLESTIAKSIMAAIATKGLATSLGMVAIVATKALGVAVLLALAVWGVWEIAKAFVDLFKANEDYTESTVRMIRTNNQLIDRLEKTGKISKEMADQLRKASEENAKSIGLMADEVEDIHNKEIRGGRMAINAGIQKAAITKQLEQQMRMDRQKTSEEIQRLVQAELGAEADAMKVRKASLLAEQLMDQSQLKDEAHRLDAKKAVAATMAALSIQEVEDKKYVEEQTKKLIEEGMSAEAARAAAQEALKQRQADLLVSFTQKQQEVANYDAQLWKVHGEQIKAIEEGKANSVIASMKAVADMYALGAVTAEDATSIQKLMAEELITAEIATLQYKQKISAEEAQLMMQGLTLEQVIAERQKAIRDADVQSDLQAKAAKIGSMTQFKEVYQREIAEIAAQERATRDEIMSIMANMDSMDAAQKAAALDRMRVLATQEQVLGKQRADIQKYLTQIGGLAVEARMEQVAKEMGVDAQFTKSSIDKAEAFKVVNKEMAMAGEAFVQKQLAGNAELAMAYSKIPDSAKEAFHVQMGQLYKQFGEATSSFVGEVAKEYANLDPRESGAIEKAQQGFNLYGVLMNGVSESVDKSLQQALSYWQNYAVRQGEIINRIAANQQRVAPDFRNSPSVVDHVRTGLSEMGNLWGDYASALPAITAAIRTSMFDTSPYTKHSPSLVEQTKSGTEEMSSYWIWMANKLRNDLSRALKSSGVSLKEALQIDTSTKTDRFGATTTEILRKPVGMDDRTALMLARIIDELNKALRKLNKGDLTEFVQSGGFGVTPARRKRPKPMRSPYEYTLPDSTLDYGNTSSSKALSDLMSGLSDGSRAFGKELSAALLTPVAEEIASITDMPVGTIGNRLFNASAAALATRPVPSVDTMAPSSDVIQEEAMARRRVGLAGLPPTGESVTYINNVSVQSIRTDEQLRMLVTELIDDQRRKRRRQ